MKEEATATETQVRNAWTDADFGRAATLAYEAYGREIYSFILAQFPNSSSADDVFSQFNEDFWRGLPAFGWRCTIRAWCYHLARNAAHRHRRAPHNDRRRHLPLSQSPWAEAALRAPRTTTHPHLQTEVKNEFQRLREKLEPDDRELLTLRVDRNLSWHDVAHVMLAPDQPADDASIHKREAALRQRFLQLKKRLKQLAIEAGLLTGRGRDE